VVLPEGAQNIKPTVSDFCLFSRHPSVFGSLFPPPPWVPLPSSSRSLFSPLLRPLLPPLPLGLTSTVSFAYVWVGWVVWVELRT
jgi:hypothetical protein